MTAHPKSGGLIRNLNPDDLRSVASIFNEAIEAQESTCDVQPRTVEQIRTWLTGDLPHYETYVYEAEAGIVGWSAITRYHEREAYSPTVELVVFVERTARHAGVGQQLIRVILERAKQLGFHTAVIIVFPQPLYILESAKKMGFVQLGSLHFVVPAEGSWRDIVLLQLHL